MLKRYKLSGSTPSGGGTRNPKGCKGQFASQPLLKPFSEVGSEIPRIRNDPPRRRGSNSLKNLDT